jgi:hypothetical protein
VNAALAGRLTRRRPDDAPGPAIFHDAAAGREQCRQCQEPLVTATTMMVKFANPEPLVRGTVGEPWFDA